MQGFGTLFRSLTSVHRGEGDFQGVLEEKHSTSAGVWGSVAEQLLTAPRLLREAGEAATEGEAVTRSKSGGWSVAVRVHMDPW